MKNLHGILKLTVTVVTVGRFLERIRKKKLGMTVGQALSIWEEAGKPIIHLGPGENCFGLEKLLSHRDINERHLAAVREWLEERQR